MRFAVLILLVLSASLAHAQSSVDVVATWTAPTTGMPVVEYIVQLSVDGGPFTDCCKSTVPSAMLTFTVGHVYVARVAGRDAKDRLGPWSDPSLPYSVDTGPPGKCGTMVIGAS